jgi:hypothetical protein
MHIKCAYNMHELERTTNETAMLKLTQKERTQLERTTNETAMLKSTQEIMRRVKMYRRTANLKRHTE